MSDETPKPVIDLDAVFTEWNAYEARRAELHPANKATLFAALGAAGITRVVLTFDGGGDSGQTENIEAFAGNDLRDLPDATVELRDLLFREGEPRALSQPLADAIETLAYACLEQKHCGWENNEGGYGEFVFDVAEGTITLDYNERFESSENYTHEF